MAAAKRIDRARKAMGDQRERRPAMDDDDGVMDSTTVISGIRCPRIGAGQGGAFIEFCHGSAMRKRDNCTDGGLDTRMERRAGGAQ